MTSPSKLSRGVYLRGRVYWLKFQRNGKRRYVSLETGDAMEAMRRAAEVRRLKLPDEVSEFMRVVGRFLEEKRRLNIFSKATERVHGAALREFGEAIEGGNVERVTTAQLATHYARLQGRVKETTAQIHMRALRAFFAWCRKQGLLARSPFEGVRLKRIDQPARVLYCTRAQRDGLLEAAPTDDLRFIFFAGSETGMRKNEIIETRVGWFDLTGKVVHLQNTASFRIKDREARTVPLTKRFVTFLKNYLRGKRPEDFALRPEVEHGKGIYRYDFHRPFNEFLIAQKMEWVTAHVLRHTFASLLVQAGVSIYKVARWMGDGVEVVEKHYGHLAPGDTDIERIR